MESNVKIPFVSPEQLVNLSTSSQNKNLDAIDEINRAKALLNLIVSSAKEDGVGQAAENGIDHLFRAIELLDVPQEADGNRELKNVEPEREHNELTRHNYLNPRFMPNHVDEVYCERTRTSGLAGDLWAMISTAESAFDSASGVPVENRGICTTLQIAKHMAGDLIEWCEFLEKELSRAKKLNHCTGEPLEKA